MNPHNHDPMFWMCTLFDPIIDSLSVSSIMVFHATHSHVPLHIQMIISNYPQSLQSHRYWCFLPPPSLPLVHNNLEMPTYTQT